MPNFCSVLTIFPDFFILIDFPFKRPINEQLQGNYRSNQIKLVIMSMCLESERLRRQVAETTQDLTSSSPRNLVNLDRKLKAFCFSSTSNCAAH